MIANYSHRERGVREAAGPAARVTSWCCSAGDEREGEGDAAERLILQ